LKITSIKTWAVPPRWALLKIETDVGISGWGEPVLEGRTHTVLAAVEEMKEELIGQDPRNIEKIWTRLYRGSFYRGGPVLMSAIAGIDQALWDIKGKHYDAPISDLLGGAVRHKIRAYSWLGGDRPSNIGPQVKKAKEAGFTAFKMNGTAETQHIETGSDVDEVIARVADAREAGGPEMGIAIDFHGRVHRGLAKVLFHELEQFRPLFIEEPVLPQHMDALKNIAQQTSIPIAVGERLFSRYDFRPILEAGWVDIVQPDLSHCGGITEGRKIATLAETYDVALALHCPLGPVALASCLQVDAVSHNAVIQEQSTGMHYNGDVGLLDYIVDRSVLSVEDGYLIIPTGPGLGIEIDEEVVETKSKEMKHQWRNPIWEHPDGSVAEW
jgi:galactonate dehydratase|tara:strand:- start:14581 stop:15732 length:1152 start_codon:yes stop_codon:yes gene_type:complete